jgi:hypothetical protein
MRSEILDYLNANKVAGFTPTSELPWDSSGRPLYLKNYKRIYVDQDQVVQEPLIDVLNGPSGIVNENTTVVVYVATDAKNAPSNLSTLVSTIKNARLDPDLTGATQRATQVSTEFVGDAQVTSFEISFRELIVNQ